MPRSISRCRLCGNADLRPVLDLGEQYLTGVFPRRRDLSLTRGPLELVKCHGARPEDHCGLVQLRHSYDAAEMYGENYGYRSSLNRSMVEHLHKKNQRLQAFTEFKRGDLVLDIGANDGTLLSFYPRQQLTLVGIDPSAGKFRKYYRDDIRLLVDFFTARLFGEHFANRKARLITSIAMFYDLDDPQSFVNDVASILADDGVWHLEQSYLAAMLRVNAYDTICHEHVEYYALRQIKWMMDRAGLKIVDVEENDINGGSFALTVVKADGPRSGSGNPRAVEAMMAAEAASGLDTLAPYERFKTDVFEHRDQLRIELEQFKAAGKLVVGYGASTKGNVILQFCNITPEMLPCIADVNEDKHGCVTPGTWIPIVSEADAKARRPDVLLALPWHFRSNFLQRERAFLEAGGKFLFPLPAIEVVSQ